MLAPGDVLVRFARPERLEAPGARAAAEALLTEDERARVARFHFERDRLLHLAARALLRRSLSRCAPVPPEAWRFGADPRGRPFVAAPRTTMRFSVSHTLGLAAVAIAVDAEVGVDVEVIPAEVPHEVVESSLAPTERAQLADTPPAKRTAAFAALWTLKEAYAKARGLGLALPFEGFAVALDPPGLAEARDSASWYLQSIVPTGRHRAAVCAERQGGVPPRVYMEAED